MPDNPLTKNETPQSRGQPSEETGENRACQNTDRELWRERQGDYYSPSIHVTEQGAIGIDCGGLVHVKPVREWHRLAMSASPNPSAIKPTVTANAEELDSLHDELHKIIQCSQLGWSLGENSRAHQLLYKIKSLSPPSSAASPAEDLESETLIAHIEAEVLGRATPRPWHQSAYNPRKVIARSRGDSIVCDCTNPVFVDQMEQEANAKLIIAAVNAFAAPHPHTGSDSKVSGSETPRTQTASISKDLRGTLGEWSYFGAGYSGCGLIDSKGKRLPGVRVTLDAAKTIVHAVNKEKVSHSAPAADTQSQLSGLRMFYKWAIAEIEEQAKTIIRLLQAKPESESGAASPAKDLEEHVKNCPECSGPDDGCEEGQRLEENLLSLLPNGPTPHLHTGSDSKEVGSETPRTQTASISKDLRGTLSEWQPIESAPKDGTVIDLWIVNDLGGKRWPDCFWGKPDHSCGEAGEYCDSDWHSEEPGWVDVIFQEFIHQPAPTLWMPVPTSPVSPDGQGQPASVLQPKPESESGAASPWIREAADNIVNYLAHTPCDEFTDAKIAGLTPAIERMIAAASRGLPIPAQKEKT